MTGAKNPDGFPQDLRIYDRRGPLLGLATKNETNGGDWKKQSRRQTAIPQGLLKGVGTLRVPFLFFGQGVPVP